MRGRGLRGAVLPIVALAAVLVLGAVADADTIELKAGPLQVPQPSQAEVLTSFQLTDTAFLGTVLLPGAQSACPGGYAQAMAVPGAYSVLAEDRAPTVPPALGEAVGEAVTLPTGTFSLCGWAQLPEGNTPTGRVSAAAGPIPLTVGGPTGSTDVVPPATPQGEAVQVPVSYSLALAGGQIPGLATANIVASAMSEVGRECGSGAPAVVTLAATASRALATSGTPVQGTIDFTGHLSPGTWRVCAYLVQNFAIPPTGLPNLVNPLAFGRSSGTVTVLGPPHLSSLRARPRVLRRGHAPAVTFVLDQPAEVTVRLQRLVPGGRRGSRRCLADPAAGARVCGRTVSAGTVRFQAPAGANVHALGRRLAPGLYLLSAMARAVDGTGPAPSRAVLAVLR